MSISCANTALSVRALSAGYRGKEILHELSLPSLDGGTITAVIGPNGAGKTTLLRALGGLLPARGTVLFDGIDLLSCTTAERARRIAYMPQSLPQGIALTVTEALITALRSAPGAEQMTDAACHRRADAVLDRLGLADLALNSIDRLSGGQRQLASLAQAIVRQPSVLLLDEPTSALDPRHQLSVMGAVRDHATAHGAVVLVVLHDLNLALQWADKVLLLKDGTLHASGVPDDAVTATTLADTYGISARVESCSRGRPHILFDGLI